MIETSFRTRDRVRSAGDTATCRPPYEVQMLWTCFRIGDAETPSVLQRGHGFAGGLDFGGIDLGEENPGLDGALRQHLAPGIDDQRMAQRLPLVLVTDRL